MHVLSDAQLDCLKIDPELLAAIPEHIARAHIALPITLENGTLHVALPEDVDDSTVDLLTELVGSPLCKMSAARDKLTDTIDIHYRAMESVVQKCPRTFLFRCSKRWSDLERTSETEIRYCSKCRTNVRLCEVGDELDRAVARGECVAFYERSEEFLGLMIDEA